MKSSLFLLSFLFQSIIVQSQFISNTTIPDKQQAIKKDINDDSFLLSSTITASEMKMHLQTLASDAYQGREAGHPGNDLAASYIANELKKLSLPEIGERNGYYQNVSFTFSSWKKNELTINGKKYRQLWDYIGFPQTSQSFDFNTSEVVFAGFGITEDHYDDYASLDVKDKVVIVFDGEPVDTSGKSYITNDYKLSSWTTDYEKKRLNAEKNGAEMLLIASSDIKAVLNANRRLIVNRVTELGDHLEAMKDHTNMLIVSSTVAQEILKSKIDKIISNRNTQKIEGGSIKGLTVSADVEVHQKVLKDVLKGQNVLAYIEGTDKKDEIVIVSAHYDHIGMRGDAVYNGADDNGSGTTTVLEITEALAIAKIRGNGPRRSILCLFMTGEEKGLLGSEYYVANPLFPLQNTIADVNIDMVGRWGQEYQNTTDPYIYVIGSDRLSIDLHNINEEMNQKYSHLILDYKYNDVNDSNNFYQRSDHYNFAKNNIPSIFYFNGVHDDYHRNTDTVDKIDFNLMESRGRLIFHTIWNLANREDRIQLNGYQETTTD